MGLYNRFCKRFFAAVIIRLTAQSDSRAQVQVYFIPPFLERAQSHESFLPFCAVYPVGMCANHVAFRSASVTQRFWRRPYVPSWIKRKEAPCGGANEISRVRQLTENERHAGTWTPGVRRSNEGKLLGKGGWCMRRLVVVVVRFVLVLV